MSSQKSEVSKLQAERKINRKGVLQKPRKCHQCAKDNSNRALSSCFPLVTSAFPILITETYITLYILTRRV